MGLIQLVQIGILLLGGIFLTFFSLHPLELERHTGTLISHANLSPIRIDELIDVVYVYANKTHPKFLEGYQNLLRETDTANRGFLRSPPTEKPSIDMDLMHYSVRMLKKMAKNLGNIYIMVRYEEELSSEIRQIPGVQVVLDSQLYKGIYFSAGVKESVQHRIPGLGTFYVTMNDDMIVTKPVDLRAFFFATDGSPRVMSGSDATIESARHVVNRLTHTRKGGALPQIKYTLKRLAAVADDVHPCKRMYPSHAPRPFHREFIEYVQSIDPELFQTSFKTHFRCQECLNANALTLWHSCEAGALRNTKTFTSVVYVDSPSTWKRALTKWDDLVSITIQEVEPSMHATVAKFLEENSRP